MIAKHVVFILLAAPCFLSAAYDSALTPYPERRESFGSDVEVTLQSLQSNAPQDGAFCATVCWKARFSDPDIKLDTWGTHMGPLTTKWCPCWFERPDKKPHTEGAFTITGRQGDFVIEKPPDASFPLDWWQKQGEHIFSRRFSVGWDNIWRFHHDALEADTLAYCEGLGLLLWAFQPLEYISRAENLEVGPDRPRNGGVYKTLVATPSWIKKPLYLENRTHFPFNESTLMSWAVHRPVVRYFIDSERGLVAGAEFVYHRLTRDSPKDWHSGSKPNGLLITCFATELARDTGGTWYPTQIVGEVYQGEDLLRRTEMSVTLADPPQALSFHRLPPEKRMKDPWPPYRVEVYEKMIASGDVSHASRFGLAEALAYEGQVDRALEAIGDALAFVEEDKELSREKWGGVDWELGFALYEVFWRLNDAELATFWSSVPKTFSWFIVIRKAVELYSKYRPQETERSLALLERYRLFYSLVREPSYKRRCMHVYLSDLKQRVLSARTEEERGAYQKLADELEAYLAGGN